jgi:hypothetical protein
MPAGPAGQRAGFAKLPYIWGRWNPVWPSRSDVIEVEGSSAVKKLIALALIGIGVFAVWRKVQADRAELDLWTEATAADED